MNKIKYALALILGCSSMNTFAQDEPKKPAEPEKFAVYVSGASDAGINKSFSSKLLFAIVQGGKYAEIGDSETFYAELAENPGGAGRIAQTAKQHGADFVCIVNMTEVFGAYSISARIIKTSDFQTVKTVALDRSLKSLNDLTAASNELVRQLFQLQSQPATPVAAAPEPVPPSPVVAAPAKECTNKFNINELVSKIQSGFAVQLKDCSSALAKNIAMSKSPFGKKSEMKEPKAFMMECTIDGIKQRLPAGAVEYVKPIESFVQNILNAASSGGSLDVKKLSGAIGGMDVNELISELKKMAFKDECAVNEPYTSVDEDEEDDEGGSEAEKGRKILSFGLRTGFNLSHLYADYQGYYGSSGTYSSIPGFQFGLLLDIAPSSWFHLQHGITYIQKGMDDGNVTSHYIELLPLSLSFKFAAFRLGAGPYFGFCVDAPSDYIDDEIDIGINAGVGFDIGMFYMGAFYEYGFIDVSNRRHYDFYNRTLGFNLGINL